MENKRMAKVEWVKPREKNYSILLAGDWFTGFEAVCPCKKDDLVDIEFEVKGGFNHITSLHIVNEAPQEINTEKPQEGFVDGNDKSLYNQHIENIVKNAVFIMEKCKAEADRIFGSDPKYKESIGTHCNSLFIEVCRRL